MRDGYDEQIDHLLGSPREVVYRHWLHGDGVFRFLGFGGFGDADCGCPLQVHADDEAGTPEMTESVRADRTFAPFDARMAVDDADGLGLALKDRTVLERLAVIQRACDAHLGRVPYKSGTEGRDASHFREPAEAPVRPWAECLAEAEKAYNTRRAEEWYRAEDRLSEALDRIDAETAAGRGAELAKEDADAACQPS